MIYIYQRADPIGAKLITVSMYNTVKFLVEVVLMIRH